MGDQPQDQRNLFIAIGLAMAILILYQVFVINPATEQRRKLAEMAEVSTVGPDGAPLVTGEPTAPRAPVVGNPDLAVDRDDAMAESARVEIRTDALSGSINLRGARLDDLQLLRYGVTIDEDAEPVTLLNPANARYGYYAFHGWLAGVDGPRDLPGPRSEWTQVSGARLTPESPITLRYDSEDGLTFLRTITIDEDYLFSITDEVRNTGASEQALRHYGVVRRNELPPDLANFYILHEGMVGVLDDKLVLRKYNKLAKEGELERRSVGGWLGVTDKYWLTALAPPQTASFQAQFQAPAAGAGNQYFANFIMDPMVIAPGEAVSLTSHVFAGAKRASLLGEYEETYGIPKFDLAIDWGNFWFLTKPFFSVLHFFGEATGNFGVAILMLTVLVKAAFFPIANAAYKSMAKMKEVQPKMTELRERFKDDPQRQQKELMALYQKEKINPLAGCLPLIPQMIVFYALYKTLFVTLEMRHAPFFGWIQDLSAPDPTSMWNIFGLLPFDPSGWPVLGGVLAIGAWPLVMGLSMAAMQSLNPAPPDKIQARIFAFMPIMFTIILAPFAAGLVIYWTWNNLLSFLQQYVIMRRRGVDTPIGLFLSNRYDDARNGRLLDWARGLFTRKRAGEEAAGKGAE